jgi:type IV pilus assembly protein PilM
MFRKKQSVCAIDFGAGTLKLVELVLGPKRIDVGKIGMITISESNESTNWMDEENLTVCLSRLLSDLDINGKHSNPCITSIHGSQIGVKQIKTAKLAPEELRSSLVFEARKHMPVKGEALLDYQVIHEGQEDLDVLLVVTTRQVIESHNRILLSCGLKPGIIDVPSLSLFNLLIMSGNLQQNQSAAIIQIGASVTHVGLLTGNGNLFSRDIPIAGNQFTEDIKRAQQVDTNEAERLKRERGVVRAAETRQNGGDDSGLQLALASQNTSRSVDSLMRELQRSIRFFLKESGNRTIDRILLSGGSAADESLKNLLEKELRMEVQLFDPFEIINIDTKLKHSERLCYTQAFGMALRRMHELFPNQFK